MEDLILHENIEQNKEQLVGTLFTDMQLGILQKRLKGKSLNNNEKTYYYKYIKPKIKAIFLFNGIEEIQIHGKEYMLKERNPLATKLLAAMSKKHKHQKIVIAGSFLFNKQYNDIDVFIFSKYNKEDYRKAKIHVNFLPESALDSLFFNSLQQISISNFRYMSKKDFVLKIEDILQSYEVLVNYILNKRECAQELRQFFLEIEYFSKKVILNPQQLHALKEIAARKNIIPFLSDTLVNALEYKDARSIHNSLVQHIAGYKRLLKEYKNAKNIAVYLKTYQEAMKRAI